MHDAPHVPELGDDVPASRMGRIGHAPPTGNLLTCPKPSGIGPAEPCREMPMALLMMRPAEARWA